MADNLRFDDIKIFTDESQTLRFTIKDRNGNLLILNGSTIKWGLAYIDIKESPVIVKTNEALGGITIESDGVFVVEVDPNDSIDLPNGYFEHQIKIIQPNGKVLRGKYGLVEVKQGILM